MPTYTNKKTGAVVEYTRDPNSSRIIPTQKDTPLVALSKQLANTPQVTQEQAPGMSTAELSKTLATPIKSPTPVTQLQPQSTTGLPEPTAPVLGEAYIGGLQGDVDRARAVVDTKLADDKKAADAKIVELKKEQKKILDKGEALTQPFREDLENAERERLHINKNFEDNQNLVNELDSLLTEGNNLIRISQGRSVANTVLQKSVNKTMADVQARAGVIQAVMSARSGQIAEAERMIDRSVNAITADRNDQLGYYDTLLSLNNQSLISLDTESKQIAETQRGLAINDLNRVQKSADFLKSLMINPDTAQFMANSGVKLTDSMEEIQNKMGKETTRIDEVNTSKAIADIALKSGYATDSELSTLSALNDNSADKQALAEKIIARGTAEEVSQKRQQFNAQMASISIGNRGKLIANALNGDAPAIKALGYDPRIVDSGLTQQDMQNFELKSTENTSFLDTIGRMTENKAGIKSSTGAATSSFWQGLFAGPLAGKGSEERGVVSKTLSLTPVLGNISNTVYAINSKKDLMADATYLVNNATFTKLRDLKKDGVTFGALTEGERKAVGAANILGSRLIIDDNGQVTGINGTEASFIRALTEFNTAVVQNQDFLNSKLLTMEERTIISSD